MRLSDAQVAAVCARAGFRDAALVKAVAVALAESGGDTQAVNINSDSTRSRDRGLFQINSRWHPEVTDAQAFDPAANAAAAYRISAGGTNWSQWAAWNNGAAALQLGRARIAVARAGQGGTLPVGDDDGGFIPGLPDGGDLLERIPGVPGVPGLPEGLAKGITAPIDGIRQGVLVLIKAGAWMADSHNWLRVAYVAGGTMGVLIALGMIGRSGAAGDTASGVIDTAGDAASMVAGGAVGAAAKAGKAGAAVKAAT